MSQWGLEDSLGSQVSPCITWLPGAEGRYSFSVIGSFPQSLFLGTHKTNKGWGRGTTAQNDRTYLLTSLVFTLYGTLYIYQLNLLLNIRAEVGE